MLRRNYQALLPPCFVSPCDILCSVSSCDRPQRRLRAIKTNLLPRECYVTFERGAAPHNPAICLQHWVDGMARSVRCSLSHPRNAVNSRSYRQAYPFTSRLETIWHIAPTCVPACCSRTCIEAIYQQVSNCSQLNLAACGNGCSASRGETAYKSEY